MLHSNHHLSCLVTPDATLGPPESLTFGGEVGLDDLISGTLSWLRSSIGTNSLTAEHAWI
jgi:hypothetical protein